MLSPQLRNTSRAWYVDPAVKRHALAVYGYGKLNAIGWLPTNEPLHCIPPAVLGVEKPRIYPGVPHVDANDLIDVWGAASWLRCDLRRWNPNMHIEILEPAQWKAQVPKPIHHARIWEVLDDRERALFPAGTFERIQRGVQTGKYSGEVHNLLDATGIGLFCEGRTGRGGVTIRL